MATHRSLNKLEFKAHMSIHNKTEVPEEETHSSNYTRDRFGKKHKIADADGRSRVRRIRKTALCLIAVPLAGTLAVSGEVVSAPAFSAGRGTDTKVESTPLNELLSEQKPAKEEPFAFYREEDTSIGLNEDGDPNMSVRF